MRILLGLIAAATFATSTSYARANDWCGFLDQEHARVHCGYSSLDECKQSLGDKKGAFCMPDPNFASRQDNRPAVPARKPAGGEG
ncbi:MAG: hypothetical protein ACRECA_12615 [Pseudolabrys sp.]